MDRSGNFVLILISRAIFNISGAVILNLELESSFSARAASLVANNKKSAVDKKFFKKNQKFSNNKIMQYKTKSATN